MSPIPKITRVRTGCWTCKRRRRKCDESKPACKNCLETGRPCEGYGLKLSFDVDDSRNFKNKTNSKGEMVHGFRGRPRLKESLAKRAEIEQENTEKVKNSISSQLGQKKLELTNDAKKIPLLVTFKNENLQTGLKRRISDPEITKNKNEINEPSMTALSENQSLQTIELQPASSFLEEFHMFQDLFPELVLDEDLAPLIGLSSFDKSMQHQGNQANSTLKASLIEVTNDELLNINVTSQTEDKVSLPYTEENMMLKHFFRKLLPLLDAHPSTPWPQLALKYCDFEVAKSCFLALSCLHLYEQKGKEEFYKVGMAHINNTMEYLISYLRDKSDEISPNHSANNVEEGDDGLNVSTIVKNLKKQPLIKQRSNFFVILLLVHVHFLFSVVESGRSALVRTFMELFGEIVKIPSFKEILEIINDDSIRFLIANLSWFDTISAVVSPDCRLPYCEENWYGNKNSIGSTKNLMGCPGEIFVCISRLCQLRRDSKFSRNLDTFEERFQDIKTRLLNFREYIVLDSSDSLKDYELKIYCAQCWMLSVLINLYRLVKPIESENEVIGLINEFIFTYSKIPGNSPLITQMVWPLFTLGTIVETKEHRLYFTRFAEALEVNGQTGTCHMVGVLMKECWQTGLQPEQILSGKEWFQSGIEFLVV